MLLIYKHEAQGLSAFPTDTFRLAVLQVIHLILQCAYSSAAAYSHAWLHKKVLLFTLHYIYLLSCTIYINLL